MLPAGSEVVGVDVSDGSVGLIVICGAGITTFEQWTVYPVAAGSSYSLPNARWIGRVNAGAGGKFDVFAEKFA